MNVAIIIFNRPGLTRRLCESVATAKPERIFVIADGPRTPTEQVLCEETRRVINAVGWPCPVIKNYADDNMGCGIRISSGLDWVFSQVEDCIILEDDCIPNPSFFNYCSEQLDFFKNDHRVGMISGYHCSPPGGDSPYSYYFSAYPTVWGWATWKDRWMLNDYSMKAWPEMRALGVIRYRFIYWLDYLAARALFDSHAGVVDSNWDAQWFFSLVKHGMWVVQPCVSLVANAGFGSDATHCSKMRPKLAKDNSCAMQWPLRRPSFFFADRHADRLLFKEVWRPAAVGWALAVIRNRFFNRYRYGRYLRQVPIVGKVWARQRQRSSRQLPIHNEKEPS